MSYSDEYELLRKTGDIWKTTNQSNLYINNNTPISMQNDTVDNIHKNQNLQTVIKNILDENINNFMMSIKEINNYLETYYDKDKIKTYKFIMEHNIQGKNSFKLELQLNSGEIINIDISRDISNVTLLG